MKSGIPLCLAVITVAAGCGPKEQAPPPPPATQAPSAAPVTTAPTPIPTPPPVWRTLRWGMTKDEVLAALPGEAQRVARAIAFGPEAPGSTDIAIPSYEAEGVTARALFGFEPTGLSRIHLSTMKPGDSTCGDLEQKLTEKFGAPGTRNATGTSLRGEEMVWKRPDQTITLACSGVSSLGFHSVALMYTPPS